jgi:hypothetical protein
MLNVVVAEGETANENLSLISLRNLDGRYSVRTIIFEKLLSSMIKSILPQQRKNREEKKHPSHFLDC